ncbi:MAG: prepilin-type N-terminal cleavage/methylation domain-containing protein [Fimbriimonadaceae bacterium]|nr:prepilin-type N-terminal cleavage/methylation domain-containing protein [Fimbriimonadaceae bacterium]QYK55580.1 MAG: prepilin-type N-terminal cleavage/methylation domain-containing protein [Fimbriimonadaceae bacterium]
MLNRRRSGFTLIELLVVIAIIAILAAILFPVFAQAKVAAKKINTTSKLKQINLAHQMYTIDFDDMYCPRWRGGYGPPNGGDPENSMSWDKLIQTYTKNYDIMYSSEDKRPTYKTPKGQIRRSFAVARNVFRGIQPRNGFRGTFFGAPETWKVSVTTTVIPLPGGTITVAEQRQDIFQSNDPWKDDKWYTGGDIENTRRSDWKNTKDPRAPYGNIDNAYSEGSVWAFADGHVRYQKVNGTASDGVFQGTVFEGYEQKAGAWVTGNGDPFWDRGIVCLDSLLKTSDATCKLPGED